MPRFTLKVTWRTAVVFALVLAATVLIGSLLRWAGWM